MECIDVCVCACCRGCPRVRACLCVCVVEEYEKQFVRVRYVFVYVIMCGYAVVCVFVCVSGLHGFMYGHIPMYAAARLL